jgi:hypothetical protein
MSQRTAAVLAFLATVLAAALVGPAMPASAAATGQWQVSCGYVGSVADDPIMLPGRPGAAHQHDFFGNFSTRAGSTYATMRGMASSCPQNDRAAYWTPSLYRNGRKVVPAGLAASYATSVSPGEERIEPFPADFKMTAGDDSNTEPTAVSRQIQWGCLGNTQLGRAVPRTCASGGIQVRITFPSCWNGRARNGNAARDLRFPVDGRCPAAFSRPLPALRIAVAYPTGSDVGALTLASGPVSSIHAGFWNTWDQARLTELVQDCLQGTRKCPHFSGISVGAVPRTRLGTGPPLAPNRIPDAPDDAAPDSAGPDSTGPDSGGALDGGADVGAPDGGSDTDDVEVGELDAGDPAAAGSVGEPGDESRVGGQEPPVAPTPGIRAPGPTDRGRQGEAAGAAPEWSAQDTPTIGAPPWTRRRTQVGDEQQADRPSNGKQQTWTFAAEQEAPAWLGLAAAGVAVLCLIGGGLWLARRRRAPLTGTR